MCRTCIDKLARPEMKDPLTNTPIVEKDIILLKSGGMAWTPPCFLSLPHTPFLKALAMLVERIKIL
mgnify:CR=1 FL=1